MRTILAVSALVLAVGASAHPVLDLTAPKTPDSRLKSPGVFKVGPEKTGKAQANCRSRIVAARAAVGLPKLPDDKDKADPLLIAAVQKTIDGCEVLVMRNDLSDFRPLPPYREGPGKVMPLGRQ
jgi:hypothetical protein